MAYLACEGLSVGYHGVPVATDIGFAVGPGDLLCIVGENGAGKSTLVKTLLGLLPPLEGSLSLGDGLAACEVGYLPQRDASQRDLPASSEEVVLSGRLARKGAGPFLTARDRAAATEALARVGADKLRDRPFGSLSGGQQQRVLLARALCAAQKLLVLDEPTTGLDPEASASLWLVLDELRAQGMAVVSVTHEVAEALGHASHVLSLGGGGVLYATAEKYRLQTEGGLRERA